MRVGVNIRLLVSLSLLFVPLLEATAGGALSTEQLIEGAKKEGRLVWYSVMTVDHSKPLIDLFAKQYPFIKLDEYRAGTGSLVNRILAEHLSGRARFDVGMLRSDGLWPLMEKKLIEKYTHSHSTQYPEGLISKEGYWTGFYLNPVVVGFNTKLVPPKDTPRQWEDLLQAKWANGKISLDTEDYQFMHGLWSAWGRGKTLSYMKRLAQQGPVAQRGAPARMQLVSAGEFPLLVTYAPVVERFKSKGAPVDWVAPNPTPVSIESVFLCACASNPNSAKLFINFLLSQQTQEALLKLDRIPARKDVRSPLLDKISSPMFNVPESFNNLQEVANFYNSFFVKR